MSDADPEDDEILENPDPEADSAAEASASLNAEADETVNGIGGGQREQNVPAGQCPDENGENELNSAASASGGVIREENVDAGLIDLVENEDSLIQSASENPEGFSFGEDQAEAEGQVNCRNRNNDSRTEGDQNQPSCQSFLADHQDANQNNENAESGLGFQDVNDLAAEDEQYFPRSCVGADSSASLEPEGNVTFRELNDGEAEGAVGASVGRVQSTTSHRTESSSQLDDEFASQQFGAGSHTQMENERDIRNPIDGCEADGASASGQDASLEPESELGENRSDLVAATETEPTESDNEIQVDEHSDNAEAVGIAENILVTAAESNFEQVGDGSNDESNSDNLEVDINVRSENAGCDEKNVPEDEISVVATVKPESYQPECDQSENKDNTGAVGNSLPMVSQSFEEVEPSSISNIEKSTRNEARHYNRNTEDVQNNCDTHKADDECSQSTDKRNETFEAVQTKEVETVAAFTKESGAIPKQRTKMSDYPSLNRVRETKQGHFTEHKKCQKQEETADSEDDLLSELDATLKSNSSVTGADSGSDKSAMSQEEQTADGDKLVSCDQCVRNNLHCSFKRHNHDRGGNSNIPGSKELKRQLHQAKQMLLDRECEISR